MTDIELLKNFIFKMADDQLIIGHRNSEWTGLGPILEEDIAFSSMAQDKIGQSEHLFNILHQLGEKDADSLAFNRKEKDFLCCHLVEYPIGEYDFSLVRHFLFDFAETIRFQDLKNSSFEPLKKLANKFDGEIKYHTMHAKTWLIQLGNGNEESHAKMQSSLNICWNFALGIFEPSNNDQQLIDKGIYSGEEKLKERWLEIISPIIEKSNLKIPNKNDWQASFGGRYGSHTEYLKPLIDEMSEVFQIDPNAEW